MRAVFIPLVCAVLVAIASNLPLPTIPEPDAVAARIEPNDNIDAAGALRDGVLSVSLVAGAGTWFPEADAGPGHDVYAFGEAGRALRNPGPLIRVPAGTEIHATIRNAIDGAALTVHGLHDRPGTAPPLIILPGDSATVRFRVTAPGTYFYWASTHGARVPIERFGKDSQLSGALIVDPPGARIADHVFVIGIEDDSAALPPNRTLRAAVVNGRSWPHATPVTVHAGDTVRMRWINVTDRMHPMHLHGFYFQVESRGDLSQDTLYDARARRLAVTELMSQGTTMSLSWIPERPGNWLMHCHMAEHMSPHLRSAPAAHGSGHAANHSLDAMAGIVTGWRVLPRGGSGEAETTASDSRASRRMIRLLVQSGPARHGASPTLGFALQSGNGEPRTDSVAIPGPPLVLTRGEPVQITVVNRLDEPTSIHWHGIELDSYYDGVSGWSGMGTRLSPQIAPRDSFLVRFTPPRAGTFIYHSHFEEQRQLGSGMFGPLIVLEPGQQFDPDTDRAWVIGQLGPDRRTGVLLNGSATPVMEMVQGRTYRIRLINISPNIPLNLTILVDSLPAQWRAVAKDGADLPAHQATMRPAVLMIGVGETYDFEFTPTASDSLSLTMRGPFGPIRVKGVIRVQ